MSGYLEFLRPKKPQEYEPILGDPGDLPDPIRQLVPKPTVPTADIVDEPPAEESPVQSPPLPPNAEQQYRQRVKDRETAYNAAKNSKNIPGDWGRNSNEDLMLSILGPAAALGVGTAGFAAADVAAMAAIEAWQASLVGGMGMGAKVIADKALQSGVAPIAADLLAGDAGPAIPQFPSMGSQRGATSIPGELYDQSQMAPKLKGFLMPDDPSMRADQSLAMLRATTRGASHTATERAVAQQYGLSADERAGMNDILIAENLLARLDSGVEQLPYGMDRNSVSDLLRLGTDQFLAAGPDMRTQLDKMEILKNEYRRWMGETAARKVMSGTMEPEQVRKNYVPHIIEDRLNEEPGPRMLGDVETENLIQHATAAPATGVYKPGVSVQSPQNPIHIEKTKHAEGSVRPIVWDAYQAGAVADYKSQRDKLMGEYIDRLMPYSVDIATAKANPSKYAAYSVRNGEFVFFPKELAAGLSDAAKSQDPNAIMKTLGRLNNVVRTGQLLVNPSFQLRQISDDSLNALSNTRFRDWFGLGGSESFPVGVGKRMAELQGAFSEASKGKFSQVLKSYRDRGLLTEPFEALTETVGDVKKITQKAVAKPFRDQNVLSRLAEGGQEGLENLGKIRETAIKGWLADTFKARGATDERAAYWANRVVGNYLSKSPNGRIVAELAPLSKWMIETTLRLTKDAAVDPVTGKNTVSGFMTGPWPKIAAAEVARRMWNSKAAPEMTEAEKKQVGSGFVIGEDEGGYVVLDPGLLNQLVVGIAQAAEDGWESKGGSLLEAGVKRLSPWLRGPLEMVTDRKGLVGAPIEPNDVRGMKTEDKETESQKRGNLPLLGFRGQHYLESLMSPARHYRNLRSEDSEEDLSTFRLFGVPVRKVSKTGAQQEDFFSQKDRRLQEIVDSDMDPDKILEYLESGGTDRDVESFIDEGLQNEILNEIMSKEDRRDLKWNKSGRSR